MGRFPPHGSDYFPDVSDEGEQEMNALYEKYKEASEEYYKGFGKKEPTPYAKITPTFIRDRINNIKDLCTVCALALLSQPCNNEQDNESVSNVLMLYLCAELKTIEEELKLL